MCVGCVEEISGIASQSSCSEWETRRNRYTGQVFQVFEEGWAGLGWGSHFIFFLAAKQSHLPKEKMCETQAPRKHRSEGAGDPRQSTTSLGEPES